MKEINNHCEFCPSFDEIDGCQRMECMYITVHTVDPFFDSLCDDEIELTIKEKLLLLRRRLHKAKLEREKNNAPLVSNIANSDSDIDILIKGEIENARK